MDENGSPVPEYTKDPNLKKSGIDPTFGPTINSDPVLHGN